MPRVAEPKRSARGARASRADETGIAPVPAERPAERETPARGKRTEPEVVVQSNVIPAHFAGERGGAGDRVDLGLKLKRMRTDKGWTLEEVSQRTGVARSTLSKIENGQMSPTYDVLQRITRGLDLDLVELFDTRRQVAPGGRRSVFRAGEGKQHPTRTYHYEVLATDLSRKQMLPFKAKIRARSLDDFAGWVAARGRGIRMRDLRAG